MMFEISTGNGEPQRFKRLPNLYMQYRLLHSFWGPANAPSREYTKTALQMAMNASYRSFLINFDFALDNDLIRIVETEWSRVYAITNKGVSVHNELELVFSLLFNQRQDDGGNAVADNCAIGPLNVGIRTDKDIENQLSWIR